MELVEFSINLVIIALQCIKLISKVVKTPAITPVTIFYTNCNDLRNKIPELQVVSQTYQNCKIMCITETMFTSDILDAEVNIPNFNIYRGDRDNGKCGGDHVYTYTTVFRLKC